MASWIVHLRIADELADDFDFDHEKFIVGNIAPDSGMVTENGVYSHHQVLHIGHQQRITVILSQISFSRDIFVIVIKKIFLSTQVIFHI